MSSYLTSEDICRFSDEGRARMDEVIPATWRAEEHRTQARRLLAQGSSDALAAAQVHATLALSLTDRGQGA